VNGAVRGERPDEVPGEVRREQAALLVAGFVDLFQWVLLPSWGLAGVGFFAGSRTV